MMRLIDAFIAWLEPDDEIIVDARRPQFRYWRAKYRDWRWHLKAANGEIVAIGEGYITKAGVLRGIASMQRNTAAAEIVEVAE